MQIMTIVCLDDSEEWPWIVDAWDEWSIDENPSGWQEAIQKAETKGGDIRVATVEVPDGWMKSLFTTTAVIGKVEAKP